MPPPENSSHRLLVEGIDDQHSIVHLVRRHGFDWDAPDTRLPYVNTAGGLPQLMQIMPLEIRGPYEALGIVVDADSDVSGRWQQIRAAAAKEGVGLPSSPSARGTVAPGPRAGSRFGVWLMPDNTVDGSLETFLAKLVPAGDECWRMAETAVESAFSAGCGRPGDRMKHILHTWLAWKDPPGMPFGTALKAEVFSHDSAVALAFVDWFKNLYAI